MWLLTFIFLIRWVDLKLPAADPKILPVVAFLTGMGAITITRLYPAFGIRQALWILLAVPLFFLAMWKINLLAIIERHASLLIIASLALTGLTLFLGTFPSGEGPTLWLPFGVLYVQPSEVLKITLIIFLAAYFPEPLSQPFPAKKILLPSIILFIGAAGFFILQRDLGTSIILLVIFIGMLFLATGKKQIILAAVFILLLALVIGYFSFGVIKIRLDAWLNPWLDPGGNSYQIVQSIISVASGSIFGRGPGLGNPRLVPLSHSDFIYTSIAEEFGLFGALAVLISFAFLVTRAFKISLSADHPFDRYVSGGIGIYLAAQSMLIIGGNIRLFPLTGVTLPFVSYGGSSLITCFTAIMLLLLISANHDSQTVNNNHYFASPTSIIQTLVITVFILSAGFSLWWSVIQRNALQSLPDNLRPAIADLYVPRGEILDRNGKVIVENLQIAGLYQRNLRELTVSHLAGFSNILYGQAGIEASMDPVLRGYVPVNRQKINYYHWFYSQHPPGNDLALTIDLNLQKFADQEMGDLKGALLLMDVKSGDILISLSHPLYDPNQLEKNFTEWIQDENAPLLNRATQGQYPLGTGITPFITAALLEEQPDYFTKHSPPEDLTITDNNTVWQCALPQMESDWKQNLKAGCPAAIDQLNRASKKDLVLQLMQLGLFESPDVPIAQAQPVDADVVYDETELILGSNDFKITPLQALKAISALNNEGVLVNPRLVLENNLYQAAEKEDKSVFTKRSIWQTLELFRSEQSVNTWESLGTTRSGDSNLSWYFGGTIPTEFEPNYVIVLLLESDQANWAEVIGSRVLQEAIKSYTGQNLEILSK